MARVVPGDLLKLRQVATVMLVSFSLGSVALCSAATNAQTRQRWTWNSVREQLNAEAKSFHSLSARIERTKVTVVVNERSTDSGEIFVRGDKMLIKMNPPEARTVLRLGDELYIYNPGLKRVEEYDLGKNRGLVDQFLLLGFGTRGDELQKNYLVTLLREEKLGDNETVLLELTPKSAKMRRQISRIRIWFNEADWLPVQQEFFETGSQDYSIVRYFRLVRNPSIPESTFKPRWPKGTQKIKLQS